MSDNDKNLHLSPVLDKIRDYGPGEAPGEESEVTPEELLAEMSTEAAPDGAPEPEPASPDTAAEETAEEPPPAPPAAAAPAPAKSSKLPVYSLIVLWLMTLAGGFGAFVWQQTRIDALALELRDERGKGRDLVAAAEREATRLADRVVELDDTIAGLRMALADAENQAATLAIASVDAAPPEQPALEPVEEPIAPEPAPEVAEAAAEPIAAPVAAPEPAAPEQQVTEAPTQEAPVGPWYINLSTLSSQAAAEQWLAERSGVPDRAEIIPVQSGGKTLYRVRVGGYASRDEAMGLAERLGARSAWASKG